ncbi:MAG: T9SS type A sorting domain-containing protein [Sphingobacteriia bacterium]|nr:T9SS type A sorting domain-containing protein [Sphingobacteriia bacterium]
MKRILFVLSALFVIYNGFGQITTSPPYPTDTDAVLLTFDATGTPLESYSGDVYTHTGVLIEGDDNWHHVIGNWGNNTTQPKLTGIGNHQYTLSITPSIRDFYDVPANEIIRQMAFVFRSADGVTQTVNLYVDVFETGLSIIITSPDEERVMMEDGEVLSVVAVSPQADSVFLYINNTLELAIAGISVSYDLTASSASGYWNDIPVEIVAKDDVNTVSSSFVYFVIPPPEIANLPEGVSDGINYLDENTIILSLYAPLKNYAFVLGDFNNWTHGEAFYMKKTPELDRYWIQINDLQPGQEYIFQYEVDGEIRIGDPFAEKVSDPWNDQYINEDTYPDLISYPEDMTSGIATVLQTAQEPYEWQTTVFTPPAVEDMVIYELLIRDFTAKHTFQSLIDTIGYFKRLGVNVIELMPVNEFEGNLSWGYNPNYYFAVDKYYGPKNTLKAFIDTCHANGIAVVIDMVLNHSFGTAPYVMLYWDKVNNRPAANSPFYNPVAKHDFNVGYDFNHESEATREFAKRVNNFWLTEYKVDGFRFDLSKGFTQKNTLGNTGAWGHYDQTRINIWDDYSTAIWQTKPGTYIILEHFADNSEEKVLSGMGMMLWGNLNYNYNEATMGWNTGTNSDFSSVSYKKRGWDDPHLVGYMESHDEQRLMYKNYLYGNSNGGYNIKDTTISLQRIALAANFFFTIPGPKMIWQFGEYGYDVDIEFNGRTGQKPIRWYYLDDWRREYLFNVFSALTDLKKNYQVFRTDDYTLNLAGANKYIVLRHASMDVVVVGNFGVTDATITPSWPVTGTWHEFYSQSEFNVPNTSQSVTLAPGEYRLFSTMLIEKPEWLNTSVDETEMTGWSDLFRVYPNPSNGAVNFVFMPENQGDIQLSIYNIQGQLVTEVKHKITSVSQVLEWNPYKTMIPGVYMARITAGNRQQTVKLLLE